MFCQNCGTRLDTDAKFCPNCGQPVVDSAEPSPPHSAPDDAAPLPPAPTPTPAVGSTSSGGDLIRNPQVIDPILAGALSGCCLPGLGQIIIGQVVKGLALMALAVVLAVVTGGVGIIPVWIIIGVDAYFIARKLREGQAVAQWEFYSYKKSSSAASRPRSPCCRRCPTSRSAQSSPLPGSPARPVAPRARSGALRTASSPWPGSSTPLAMC